MGFKYTYNYDFFRYWSHDLAYFLGFLMADGRIINDNSNTYAVAFNSGLKDKPILDWIRNKICPEKPLMNRTYFYKQHNKKYYSVRWALYNKRIYERLLCIGIPENKTGNEIIPDGLPSNLIPSFICGYFDGDGSVFIRRNGHHCNIVCANEQFLKDIISYIDNIGYFQTVNKPSGRDLYYWKAEFKQARRFRDYIYKHKGFCLKRKHDIFYKQLHITNRLWTENETKYLTDNYQDKTYKEISLKIKRTPDAMQAQARKLGLTRS